MESSTAVPAHPHATGSTTIADLIGLAAEQYGDAPAIRHKRDGEWRDVSYAELGEIVSEVGRGLIDLGIAAGRPRGDPVHARAPSGPTPTSGSRRAGAVVVPDLPDQLAGGVRVGGRQLRVARDRLRGRRAGREDPRGPRRSCPALETIIVIDPAGDVGDAIPLDELRERGRGPRRGRARPSAPRRSRATSRTRSSTPRARPVRRRAACSATATTATSSRCASATAVVQAGDVAYLFLPLAHSFALLIQLAVLDVGATLAYFGGDPKQIIVELSEVRPDLPPVGAADLREALHAGHRPRRPRADQGATQVGPRRSARCRPRARRCRPSCRRTTTAPRRSCSRTSAPRSAGGCARRRPARRRSPRRSSSSSSPAACPCSRATG